MRQKKIKGYLPLYLVRWIQSMAKTHRVKPSNVIRWIVAETVRNPKKALRELVEWSSNVPTVRMEMFFLADPELLKAWEDYKELNGITCDCQTMKLILRARYGYTEKAGKRQRALFN